MEEQSVTIENGRICWKKSKRGGEYELLPLCNFTAWVDEDVLKDNGIETRHVFRISGSLDTGELLPTIEVPASSFSAMKWPYSNWGRKVIFEPVRGGKDRIRYAVQLLSLEKMIEKTVYTHTGWREVGGKMVYLIGKGCVGDDYVETELEPQFERYSLPAINSDPVAAFKGSQMFLFVGALDVTLPVWVAMYMAPLSEIINPNFTIWYVGMSGAFKSTLIALALSHFGGFDAANLPISWICTANQIERFLYLGKDLPIAIEYWYPTRDIRVKTERIIRAVANRQGPGNIGNDGSFKEGLPIRGILIASSFQLPDGFSTRACIFPVAIKRKYIDTSALPSPHLSLNDQTQMYRQSMVHYLTWMIEHYQELKESLPGKWAKWNIKSCDNTVDRRQAEMVAHLMTGLETVMDFALEKGAVSDSEYKTWLGKGFDIFMNIARRQERK